MHIKVFTFRKTGASPVELQTTKVVIAKPQAADRIPTGNRCGRNTGSEDKRHWKRARAAVREAKAKIKAKAKVRAPARARRASRRTLKVEDHHNQAQTEQPGLLWMKWL